MVDHPATLEAQEKGTHIIHNDNQVSKAESADLPPAFLSSDITDHELPPGYFYSPFFLGTMAALCFNLAASVGGFALLAPVLNTINEDIGPRADIIWVALTYTICLAIGIALVGRLSDLFGRRYFLIGGNILGLIGCAVCCTATTVPVLIGGETLVGLAASTGASYPFVMGELVPMRHRFATNGLLYLFQLPTSCFGPVMAYIFVSRTPDGWRWCYYYLIIWNALALALFTAFYFPPTFSEKHGQGRVVEWLKRYDYVGTGLFIAGIVLFLMGVSWGGTIHPWKSAHVIATLIIGTIILVVFGLYEWLMPLPEPFVPVKLFKNTSWVATVLVIGLSGGVYYAFALVWPNMVSMLYVHDGDPLETGYLSCIVAIGITAGQIIGCLIAERIGHTRIQLIATFTAGAIFLSCMATCDEHTRARAIALLSLGTAFIGYTDGVAIIITTIDIPSQDDIGIATGVMGSIRSVMGGLCSTIYTVILKNRLEDTVAKQVPIAVLGAGLPTQSLTQFLQALTSGSSSALASVSGITPEIIAVGQVAYKHAAAQSFRTVFLASIAFSGLGIVLTFFSPNVDDRMTRQVAAVLNRGKVQPEQRQKKEEESSIR